MCLIFIFLFYLVASQNTLILTEKKTSSTSTPIGGGAINVFDNTVYEGVTQNNSIGYSLRTCYLFSQISASYCIGLFVFSDPSKNLDGTISYQGFFPANSSQNFTITFVGGTGGYQYNYGEISVSQNSAADMWTYSIDLKLHLPSFAPSFNLTESFDNISYYGSSRMGNSSFIQFFNDTILLGNANGPMVGRFIQTCFGLGTLVNQTAYCLGSFIIQYQNKAGIINNRALYPSAQSFNDYFNMEITGGTGSFNGARGDILGIQSSEGYYDWNYRFSLLTLNPNQTSSTLDIFSNKFSNFSISLENEIQITLFNESFFSRNNPSGKAIGVNFQICFVLGGATENVYCLGSFQFYDNEHSSISTQGCWPIGKKEIFYLPISGGTGYYERASGIIEVNQTVSSERAYRFQLFPGVFSTNNITKIENSSWIPAPISDHSSADLLEVYFLGMFVVLIGFVLLF